MNLPVLLKRADASPAPGPAPAAAVPQETIAETGIASGCSLESLEREPRGGRSVLPAVREHEDGTRWVGLVYQADHHYEELEGVGAGPGGPW